MSKDKKPKKLTSGGTLALLGEAVTKGDIFVKLSIIWWGAGYLRRRQYVKALIMTLVEAFFIWYTIAVAIPYVAKFGTLGTVKAQQTFNPSTMKSEWNDYDNSFMILLMSVFSFVIWVVGIAVWIFNTISVYRLQKADEAGAHIRNFREDIHEFVDSKFHITLMTLPVIGIVLFTIIPILILIFVAFTNYDSSHMPPTELFTWVGLDNFVKLFSSSGITVTFGYAFGKVLGWTLVWAVFATFTTYFGGIFLAMLLNNKKVRITKFWRLLFVITIAVPQFVSLLLVRYFFANNGIFNTFCSSIGLTEFLRNIGVISTSYIPFLTKPGWANVMIILINIWIGVPYQMLIATGVLTNLPQDQIESARVDGASKFQTFRHITMPFLLVVTGPQLINDFVKNINNFNVIYLLTDGIYTTTDMALASSSASEVDLLVTWLFKLTQDYYNYKMASAIGIVIFIICAAFTLIAFNFMTRGNKEGEYSL